MHGADMKTKMSVFANFRVKAPKTAKRIQFYRSLVLFFNFNYFNRLHTSKQPHFQPELVANN